MKSQASQRKFAIITPVYNGEAYLAETMASVQAQTYDNVVHVVLDNASTDATPEIIKRFEGGRVPVIVHRNTELLPHRLNWNAAVNHMPDDCDYFGVLCADDMIRPDFCAKLVALGEAHPGASVLASAVRSTRGQMVTYGLARDRTEFERDEIIRGYFQRMHAGFISNIVMFRRNTHVLGEPFYPEEFLYFDLDKVLSLLSMGTLAYSHEDLSIMRQHENSITTREAKGKGTGMSELLRLTEKYGPEIYTPRELHKALQMHTNRLYCRMLVLRFLGRNEEAYQVHRARLQAVGAAPDFLDYAAAVVGFVPGIVQRTVRRKLRAQLKPQGRADAGRRDPITAASKPASRSAIVAAK